MPSQLDGKQIKDGSIPANKLQSAPSSAVPYYIPAGQKYTVPQYAQALFNKTIRVKGVLKLSGILKKI